jgi:predicted nucleic acid-binding protein
MDILADASAILVVILEEPGRSQVLKHTKGAEVFCPDVIPFEVANGLIKMCKTHTLTEDEVKKAFQTYEKMPIRTLAIDMHRALGIAGQFSIYAYDAFYLEIAQRRELPLLTFDGRMQAVAKELRIKLLEDKNASI